MKRRLIARSFIGLIVGTLLVHIITFAVNYFSNGRYLLCMPELTEKLGFYDAAVLQTVLGGALGMIAFGGMCFFDIEEWSLLRATAAHCALILVTFLPTGLLLHWFSFHIIAILIMAFILVLFYALIWLIMYAAWKREMREMNRLTEEYKRNADVKED